VTWEKNLIFFFSPEEPPVVLVLCRQAWSLDNLEVHHFDPTSSSNLPGYVARKDTSDAGYNNC